MVTRFKIYLEILNLFLRNIIINIIIIIIMLVFNKFKFIFKKINFFMYF